VKSEYGEAYGVTSVVDMAHVRIVSGWEIRVARRVMIVRIEVEMRRLSVVVGVEDVVVKIKRLEKVRSQKRSSEKCPQADAQTMNTMKTAENNHTKKDSSYLLALIHSPGLFLVLFHLA